MHPLAQQAFDAGFQPNLTALLNCILTEGVQEAQERYETNKVGLQSMSQRIPIRMKAIGLPDELVEKVEQALDDAFKVRKVSLTAAGIPTAASLVLGPPLDQLVEIAKRKLKEEAEAKPEGPLVATIGGRPYKLR